jgi:DNA replication licensing factor MCM4
MQVSWCCAAPSIWELDDVKKGVLCQLFGGTQKQFDRAQEGKYV